MTSNMAQAPSQEPAQGTVPGLKARITDDMKAAMRAKDAPRLTAIRLLLAAIKQKEVDERISVDDGHVLAIIDKLIKQRRDSIGQFQRAGRDDLVAQETLELQLMSGYQPPKAGADDIAAAVAAAIAETGAAGPADMGKVMGLLKSRLAGRADLAAVSALVRTRLRPAAS